MIIRSNLILENSFVSGKIILNADELIFKSNNFSLLKMEIPIEYSNILYVMEIKNIFNNQFIIVCKDKSLYYFSVYNRKKLINYLNQYIDIKNYDDINIDSHKNYTVANISKYTKSNNLLLKILLIIGIILIGLLILG